jgi:hypothetical protein
MYFYFILRTAIRIQSKKKNKQQQQEVNSLAVEKSVRMELFAASGKCLKSPTRAVDSMTVAEERKKKMRERRKRREEMR